MSYDLHHKSGVKFEYREDNATRSMGGKLALWVFIPLRLLHLGDGALRVADVRHTNRAGSRPNQHSGSATEKWLNALSLGVVWLILGVLPVHPASQKQGYPADTQPETRKHARM